MPIWLIEHRCLLLTRIDGQSHSDDRLQVNYTRAGQCNAKWSPKQAMTFESGKLERSNTNDINYIQFVTNIIKAKWLQWNECKWDTLDGQHSVAVPQVQCSLQFELVNQSFPITFSYSGRGQVPLWSEPLNRCRHRLTKMAGPGSVCIAMLFVLQNTILVCWGTKNFAKVNKRNYMTNLEFEGQIES